MSKSPRPDGFTGKFYQIFGEDLSFWNCSKKFLSNSFNEATITQMLKPDKDTTHTHTHTHTQKKEKRRRILLANITEEPRCKNSQQLAIQIQYIKKIIYHDQVGLISGIQGFFNIHKSNNVIHHIKKLKNKIYMIISI